MPLWVALAIPLAAFVVRSAVRGFDFTPDLPSDVVVLAILLVVVALVAWLRADDTRRDSTVTSDSPSETTDPES